MAEIMSNIKVITVASDIHNEGLRKLGRSLALNDWDAHIIPVEWKGFGTKLIEVYNYLVSNPEIERFIFCDAYDVVALGTPEEFLMKLQINGWSDIPFLFSAEKGCWPNPELGKLYRNKFDHGFNYLNSGLYYGQSNWFKKLIEANPIENSTDDQGYFTNIYLNSGDLILIDNDQTLFNSYSFIKEGEYTYHNDRLQVNGNQPIFVHGNGRQDMTEVYKLLK